MNHSKLMLSLSCFVAATLASPLATAAPRGGGGHGMAGRPGMLGRPGMGAWNGRNWNGRNWSGRNWNGRNWNNWNGNWHHHHNNNVIFIGDFGFPFWWGWGGGYP